ncbi:MAG: hypothetical protein II388_01545 [Clostridia bacterium]|nr:hypothetical protein [Clostridia bacterium]
MIMPLETFYHGVYFRSKTEARFAVFLDCIGIKWEYEPQGFSLGNGLNYLPDFKIYNVSTYHGDVFRTYDYMWVEVKGIWDGKNGKLTQRDFEKIMRFAFDDTFDGDCWGREVKNPIWVAGNTFTLDPTNENYIYGDTDWGPCGLINNFITIDADSYGFVLACPKECELVLCGRDSNYFLDHMKTRTFGERYEVCCDNILEALREANRYKFDHGNQYKIASCLLSDFSEKDNLEKLKAKKENNND